jgi:hypothetical protein
MLILRAISPSQKLKSVNLATFRVNGVISPEREKMLKKTD